MLKRILEYVRGKNRARLERRQLAKAGLPVSGGWLFRTTMKLRARNHARLERRRAQRGLLASLAANDTAMLEAMVFLLKGARQEQRARSATEAALDARLASVEARVDAGVSLLEARIQELEARLAAAGLGDGGAARPPALPAARQPASPAGVNGEAQRSQPQLALAGVHGQPSGSELSDPGEKRSRRS